METNLAAQNTAQDAKLQVIEGLQNSQDAKLQAIEDVQNSIQVNVTTMMGKLQKTLDALEPISASLTAVSDKVATGTKVDNFQQEIAAKVDDVVAKVAAVEGKVDTVDNKVGSVGETNAWVEQMKEDVATMKTGVETLTTATGDMKTEVDAMKSGVETLDTATITSDLSKVINGESANIKSELVSQISDVKVKLDGMPNTAELDNKLGSTI
eukprot:g3734.t1